MQYLYEILPAAAIATAIAILSGLGVGSGGLLVIWLTLIGGMDAERARGLNLLFFVFSAGAAFMIHALRGRVKLSLAASLSLLACLGTLVGTYIGLRVDALWLKRVLGAMLTASGGSAIIGMLKDKLGGRKKAHFSLKKRDIYIK